MVDIITLSVSTGSFPFTSIIIFNILE